MRYLFFDIECASVFKDRAKICAFGYCLCDEQFHIIEKEDILINPLGGFHLTNKKGGQGIVLPYSYEDFKKYPTFPTLADRIFGLLQAKDVLPVGHAVQNDVKYLNLETQRFFLPSFEFEFVDTQFIYMNRINAFDRQRGLGEIAEALHLEFTPHRAVDDAYATMKVAEQICKEENLSFLDVLKKYEIVNGKIANYTITPISSKAYEEHVRMVAEKKEQRCRAIAEFHENADKMRKYRKKGGALSKKKVTFSKSLELDANAKALVEQLYKKGGNYSFKAEECNLFVCYKDETCERLKRAVASGAVVMTPEEFTEYVENA